MVAAPKLNRLTVSEAVAAYLDSVQVAVDGRSLSPATAATYTRDLAEFVDLAGADRVLDDLTAGDVDRIVNAYGKRPDGRYKPKPGEKVKTRGEGAQARFRQSVSRLFAEAVLEGWVEASPMPRTKVRPRLQGLSSVSRKALSESSAAALLEVPAHAGDGKAGRRDMRLGLRDEFLLRLLMEAGPRVSEVSSADRADLEQRDDGTWWLHVTGKGRKTRPVPLSEGTVAAYHAYLEQERPPPRPRVRVDRATGQTVVVDDIDDAERALVLTWRGLRMKPRDIQLMVDRSCRRLPPDVRRSVTPHGLRHTAATLLLSSGAADIRTVKELLGHASISTTGIYLDTVAAELSQAVSAHPVTGSVRRR